MNNTLEFLPGNEFVTAELVMDTEVFANFAAEVGEHSTKQIFDIFINDTERRLAKMRQMFCDSDRDTIKIEAHGMKGAAATFGFHELGIVAGALERDAADIAQPDYMYRVSLLDAAFGRARRQYRSNIVLAA